MIRTAVLAALCCVVLSVNAEAKLRSGLWQSCIPTSDVMRPCAYQPDFLAGVKSIKVVMKRERRASAQYSVVRKFRTTQTIADKAENPELWKNPTIRQAAIVAPSPSFAQSIARPLRYIAGRLICAINVNAALAERGIRGTGSALAHSFDGWGVRISQPIPGAVAVTDRRGGGHVAIVSRVEGSRVFVWNPSPRGRGWREVEYTNRHARYRVAG